MIDQSILTAALEGLQTRKAKLEEDIAAVRGMIGSTKKPGQKKKAVTPATTKTRKKRVLSPEGRARISAATKKRWAAARKATA